MQKIKNGHERGKIPFPKTLLEFQHWFPDEKTCIDYLYKCRWPNGFICPKCKINADPYNIETYRRLECSECGNQTSITAGTVMHGTRTSLVIWFWGAYLVATHTPGFSALQFQKQLSINRYETAYQILHKLRAAMVRPDRDRIHSVIEVDETYIGASKAGKRGRGVSGKTIVAGAIEVIDEPTKKKRVGRLRLNVIPDVSGETLIGFVEGNVEPGSLVYTDDWSGYDGLNKAGYIHEVVSIKELEHIHRTIGNLKVWLEGTHHGVSGKHLQAYLNEFVFRHNRRRTPMAAFQTILGLASQKCGPTYEDLYASGKLTGWLHPISLF